MCEAEVVPVSIVTVALSGEVEISTIDEQEAVVKVSAGTQSEKILKLREKGMTVVCSSIHGDMFVRASVKTPINLTDHQKELLREFGIDVRLSKSHKKLKNS